MQFRRSRTFGADILASLEDHIKQYFSAKDIVTIDELVFTVNNSRFWIIYQPKANDK
ncbi:18399_t:CDS:1, partial [Gigaspora margarita]